MTTIEIITSDDKTLVLTRFLPVKSNNKVVMIQNALGMKQKYYYDFAQYLAENDFIVYTYDYRDIGLSNEGKNIKYSQTKWKDWGQTDFAAVTLYLEKNHSEQPKFLIGNSYGGNCLGMSLAATNYTAFITVGSQDGYFRLFWPSKQPLLFVLWYILMPVSTFMNGYFPSKLFGMGEPLPRQVAYDWAKVCRNKNWVRSVFEEKDLFYDNINQPILAISVEDDMYAPKKAVDSLHYNYYKNAKITRKHILINEVENQAIGHFGFFRKKFLEKFGKITVEWFNQF